MRLPIERLLPVVCTVVLTIILSLGLWPFHAPRNDVAWLPDRPGIALGDSSFAVSSEAFPLPSSAGGPGATVEIWLQPHRVWDKGTLLAFQKTGEPADFALRHSQLGLEVRTRHPNRDRPESFYFRNVLPRTGPVFITLASGSDGTALYIDGRLRQRANSLQLSARLTGRLIVGASPRQTDSWRRRLFGLAIYCRELGPAEVARHFQNWASGGRPGETGAALYLFNERTGNMIHNAAASGLDLQIPDTYTVLDQIFLNPFWREFEFSRSYWEAVLKNVVGFVPVGFCSYPWFLSLGFRRQNLAAVAFGTAISITIEVLQVFLPTRDSGTTYIITNTLGTWLGVVGYLAFSPLFRRYGLPD